MDVFTEADLRRLAGARSFEREHGYLDAVTAVEVGDGWITATVHGTDAYEVELTVDGSAGLAGECDCPYGLEGNFCKHLVALGLSVLARPDELPRQRTRAATVPGYSTRGWTGSPGTNCSPRPRPGWQHPSGHRPRSGRRYS
ncbi:SWIM zinc finger family protein [Streptomyces sp. 8N616]|uniref:SWIM zinc finger family protein n=1 Tax=Streptomyces sp. 8N616 TaxID=3457414 RepID=UPI003FD543E8